MNSQGSGSVDGYIAIHQNVTHLDSELPYYQTQQHNQRSEENIANDLYSNSIYSTSNASPERDQDDNSDRRDVTTYEDL